MFDIKRLISRFQDECLIECVRRIVVRLKLTQHHDQHTTVQCGLRVGGRYDVTDLLKSHPLNLFHDVLTTHYLLSLKCHQRSLIL